MDAILNIAESDTSSSLADQDNWLVQLKNVNNKSISFFGDDTWIKLFPGLFHETDGTTSFFATVCISSIFYLLYVTYMHLNL